MSAVLMMIAQLYAVEKVARRRELRGEALRGVREQVARPVLDRLHEYLLEIQDQLLPKSQAGQAVAYTLNNWTALSRYCGMAICPLTTTPPSEHCAVLPSAATTGPSSAVTTVARLQPCFAASSLPANS